MGRLPVRAVAFDFAGTLTTAGRQRPDGALVREVLADLGVRVGQGFVSLFDDIVWCYYVESLADSLPRCIQDTAATYGVRLPDMHEVMRGIWDRCGDHPVDEAAAAEVRAQHEEGRVVLLASNTVRPGAHRRKTLMDAGLDFMRVVCSSEIGAAKPDRGFYARIVIEAGVPAGEILFVGDNSQNDVARPLAFGMQAAHVNRRRPRELAPVRVHGGRLMVLSSVAQLGQVLD